MKLEMTFSLMYLDQQIEINIEEMNYKGLNE